MTLTGMTRWCVVVEIHPRLIRFNARCCRVVLAALVAVAGATRICVILVMLYRADYKKTFMMKHTYPIKHTQ